MRFRRRERPLVYVLIAVALVTFAIGLVYLLMVPKDLPSFLPGHVTTHHAAHHGRHGVVQPAAPAPIPTTPESRKAAIAFVVSAAIFLLAVSQSWTWRRWRHYH